MLNLETKLKVNRETMLATNLASRFSDHDLAAIGEWVWDGYNQDEFSRGRWLRRTQAAMDLALQLSKDKSFPWPGASNVAFPLVTIATMQFHARAYPAIVRQPDLIRYRVVGEDPTGEEAARARRIGCHMSYQLLEEDEGWEEQQDRLLINLPIVGCAFKKSYHRADDGVNVSELVLAKDLVLDYYAKSVESCARKTHIVPLYRNEMHTRMLLGAFVDYTGEAWYQGDATPMTTPTDSRTDRREGSTPPQSSEATPFTTLEQHCWADFDGDGYAEPYVITIEATTKKVLRIVARWDREIDVERKADGRIISITPCEYFTKYTFIPAPDGSIYDLGFGILLGPLNESVNTLVNQLIDAGTMATTAGGFLARGAKIRGGAYTFAPLEWKRVDSTGDDLQKSIYPLPVREPSAVLFNLLSLLIQYTDRISGSTDIMVGENVGQNTPAATSQELVRQGSMIYSAIFKRVWRAMKWECEKLYKLNAVFLPSTVTYGPSGSKALREDYRGDPKKICPAADPAVSSDEKELQRAIAIKQSAAATPGYNIVEVEKTYLRALHVDGIDILYPGPDKVPQGKDPKITLQELKNQAIKMQEEAETQRVVLDLMSKRQLVAAQIAELEAKAALEWAKAGGEQTQQQISAFQTAIGALKAHNDALGSRVEHLLKSMEIDNAASEGRGVPGVDSKSSDGGA